MFLGKLCLRQNQNVSKIRERGEQWPRFLKKNISQKHYLSECTFNAFVNCCTLQVHSGGAKVGPAGARAPAVKACAPAVPRQLDQRRQRAERGTCPSAPLKIIVPRLCPGSTIFLAPPLQVLRYMHLHLCSFNLSCLFWLVIVLATNSSQMRPLRYFVAPRYTATVIRHVASIVRQMDWVLHTLRPTFYHDTTCTNYLHNWAHFALFFSGKR